MRILSRLSPHSRTPECESIQKIVHKVIGHLNNKNVSAVVLRGCSGVGKSALSYHVYKSLLSRRESSEIAVYFAFDARDRRQRSISAMLIKVIQQLLSCLPELLASVQEIISNDDEMTRWTESSLWAGLRYIIRQAKFKSINMVLDSLTSCETDDMQRFLHALFELRFAAPERLKIVCTMGVSLSLPPMKTAVQIEIESLPEFKDNLVAFQDSLADSLASESPKLKATRVKIKECFGKSEGFLHSIFIAHRIRGISSLSSPTSVEADLAMLSTNWKETIESSASRAPSWAITAVCWMLFAQRSLMPAELAIAVALENWSASSKPTSIFDERLIPREIQGDIRRQLSHLVCIENGQIQISHACVADVLQGWLEQTEDKAMLQTVTLTKQLMDYLRFCLDSINAGNHKVIPDKLGFAFLEYALEYWHVHYREAMDGVVRPFSSSSEEVCLEDLALLLFRTMEYRCWLRPVNPLDLTPKKRVYEDEDAPSAVLLAAQIGLFDIAMRLMHDGGECDNAAVLQIACQHGRRDVVEYVINGIDNVEAIEIELTRACKRDNEAIFRFMLGQYKKMRKSTDVPPYLLPQACRLGHATLAKVMIDEGALVNGHAGEDARTLPLHEAVDQGHLDMVDLLLNLEADAMALFPDRSTPLLHSIKRGHRHVSRRLLREPGFRDVPNDEGVTALHLAAGIGDVELLEQILNSAPSAEPKSELECSKTMDDKTEGTKRDFPLHEAAANGHVEAVRVLLDHHFSINELDSEGKSALFLALSKNHREVVGHLFERGAKITSGKLYADSALKQAIINDNVPAVVALLKGQVSPDEFNGAESSPLTDAAWRNCAEIAAILLNANVNPDKTVDHKAGEEILGEMVEGEWTALHFAAYYGSVDVMLLFMSEYCYLTDCTTGSGHTALHLAVFKENTRIVEIMLAQPNAAAGGDINADPKCSRFRKQRMGSIAKRPTTTSDSTLFSGLEDAPLAFVDLLEPTPKRLTALHIAVANGNIGLARMLIESGSVLNAIDDVGRGVIHLAVTAQKNATDMVRFLLFHNVDVEIRDHEGKTPLHYVAAGWNEYVVFQLLENGANPNSISREGLAPLYLATKTGNSRIVRILIGHGADVNTSDNEGHTALHAAAFRGYFDVADTLIVAGADINVSDNRGDTPLHEAVRCGHEMLALLLLESGAVVNVLNARNITPLQRAVLNQWTDTARLLLKYGANPNICDEDGDTALTVGMLSDELNIVKLLLDSKAEPNVLNRHNMTPLMLALRSPNLYVLPLILAGADVILCGDNRVTVLHRAAAETKDEAVEDVFPLLWRGKDHLDVKDAEGLAPVHHAARFGRKRMIQALHGCGADLASKDAQGRTAMHHAVRLMPWQDFAEVFAEFLRPNEENKVNVPDADGWTPLHWACKAGSFPTVCRLLESCDTAEDCKKMILHKGERGWTALAVAQFHCRRNTMMVLAQALGLVIKNIRRNFEFRLPLMVEKSNAMSEIKPEDIRPVIPGQQNRYISCDDCFNDVSPHLALFAVDASIPPLHIKQSYAKY